MLSFRVTDNTLTIALHSRVIYTVRKGQAPLTVGRGSSTYKMSHGSFKIKEKCQWQPALTVEDIRLADGKAMLALSRGQCQIEIVDGNKLYFTFDLPDDCNRMTFDLPAEPDEWVYGCGENFSEFNLRGKKSAGMGGRAH